MNTDKKFPDEDCGVIEEKFPRLGKCYCKNNSLFITSYEKICPYCGILVSLPYGPSLKTVTIFECDRLGYGKRLTE